MVDAPKDASERVGALNPGRHHRAAPLFSYIGQALRRGEFFAGLFILGFSNGIFEQIMQAIAQGTIESAILGTFGINRGRRGDNCPPCSTAPIPLRIIPPLAI